MAIRARAAARQHHDIVGDPVKSFRLSGGPGLAALLVGLPFLIVIGLLILGESLGFVIFIGLLLGVIMLFSYVLCTLPRFVVCQRGLMVGWFLGKNSLLPTYVVGAHEIDPHTVAVLSSGPKVAKALNRPAWFEMFTYTGSVGVPVVSFKGPWPSDITLGRPSAPRRPNRDAVTIFTSWRARTIAENILQMMAANGALPAGFTPANGLATIQVSGKEETRHLEIPGAPQATQSACPQE